MPAPGPTKDQLKARLLNYERKLGTLEKQVAVLTEAYTKKTGQHPIEEPQPVRVDSVPRDARGRVIPDDDLPTYEERMVSRHAEQEAEYQAQRAFRSKGLPNGFYRDPTGLIRRSSDGRIADASLVAEMRDAIETPSRIRPRGPADEAEERRRMNRTRAAQQLAQQMADEEPDDVGAYDPFDTES